MEAVSPQKEVTTMTLREAIVQALCRHGKAVGTTKDGAYWLASKPIKIRDYGGDGIGQNRADTQNYLELRHYRDGNVRARVNVSASHQNGSHGGAGEWYINADAVLDCISAEAVIVALKGIRDDDHGAMLGNAYEDDLTKALEEIGLPGYEPAPDEVEASA